MTDLLNYYAYFDSGRQMVRSKRLVPKHFVNRPTRLTGWWCDSANGWERSVGIAPLSCPPFSSSRRAKPWLSFKRLFCRLCRARREARPSKRRLILSDAPGGTALTVDASRSCLGLGTCVGSAIRQIVDARVLLTAAAPPALPGTSVSDSLLAPPAVDAIMRGLSRSACCRHHLPRDGPCEPASSRAIAMVTTLAGLPLRASLR